MVLLRNYNADTQPSVQHSHRVCHSSADMSALFPVAEAACAEKHASCSEEEEKFLPYALHPIPCQGLIIAYQKVLYSARVRKTAALLLTTRPVSTNVAVFANLAGHFSLSGNRKSVDTL